MAIKIRLRGDTAANWVSADPVLDERELGIETDTDKAKLGDGVTAWTALNYWVRDGAQWFSGPGAPALGIGNDGDFYLDTDTGDIYEKVAGAWGAAIMNIGGVDGADGRDGEQWWLYDGVAPDDLDGEDGDFALRIDTGDVFEKAAGTWGVTVGNLMGPAGADGVDGIDGVGVPVGGSTGQLLAKVDATDFNTEWIDPSNVPPTITPKSGDYTLVESDNGDIIEVDATVAPVTITLPAGLSDGFQAMIVKVDASANAVTLADDGTSSVVGKGTQLTAEHDVATIYRKSGDVYRAVGDVS